MRDRPFSSKLFFLREEVQVTSHKKIFSFLAMSPFEIVHVCTNRSRSCYDIEEEQFSEMAVENNGCEKQLDITNTYSMTILRESRHNLYNDNTEDCARKNTDVNKNKVCSRFLELSSVPEENECYTTGRLSSCASSSTNTSPSRRRLPNLSSHSLSPISSETSVSDQQLVTAHGRVQQAVKSGNLILIVSENTKKQSSNHSKNCSCGFSRTLYLSRFPVIVKIYRKFNEKYAIVTRTRRHPIVFSFAIKLRQSQVVQSPSNPLHFVVKDDGVTGKSFTFEASNSEVAKEWIKAFSADSSSSRNGFPYHKLIHKNKQFSSARKLDTEQDSVSILLPSVMTLPKTPFMPMLSESLLETDEE